MELTHDDHLDPAKQHLRDRGDYAPGEVFAAMVALEDPHGVTESLVATERGEGGTTWRAVWLSEQRLTFCEASRGDHRDWTLELGQPIGQVEAKVEAWSVPLSDVSALGVAAARAGRAGFGGVVADVVWTVELAHGRAFTVPLFGDFAHHTATDAGESFVAALRTALQANMQ